MIARIWHGYAAPEKADVYEKTTREETFPTIRERSIPGFQQIQLLRKDLPQIAQTFYKNNKPSIMFFPTNGIQPDRIAAHTEEILKTCPNTACTVKISIDAIGDLHSQMRGVKNTFENCIKTYEALNPLLDKYPNFDLAVNTVFAQANQHCVGEVIDYVRKWRVTTHTLSLARGDLDRKSTRLNSSHRT